MAPYPSHSVSLIQSPNFGVKHLLLESSYVNLQTQCNQYGPTTKIMNTNKGKDTTPMDDTLHFPRPPIDGIPKVPRFPLHRIVNNPNAHVSPSYSVLDDLL